MLPCAVTCNPYFAEVLEVLTGAQAFHKSLPEQEVFLAQVPQPGSACTKAHRHVQRKVTALIGKWEEKKIKGNQQEKLALIFSSYHKFCI